MKFAKKNNDCNKFVTSSNAMTHQLQCTLCQAKQDFDDMDIKQAREIAYNAGWRKGTDSFDEVQCCCPECFQDNEVNEIDDKHFTEMNSYGE